LGEVCEELLLFHTLAVTLEKVFYNSNEEKLPPHGAGAVLLFIVGD